VLALAVLLLLLGLLRVRGVTEGGLAVRRRLVAALLLVLRLVRRGLAVRVVGRLAVRLLRTGMLRTRRLLTTAPGARKIGPAAQAEQIALLEGLVTDRAFQGRHDTSPARTPARSSVDVRCSMSPLRGIPM
jgi:hypothetical protein